jgi:hypothetical protein
MSKNKSSTKATVALRIMLVLLPVLQGCTQTLRGIAADVERACVDVQDQIPARDGR